ALVGADHQFVPFDLVDQIEAGPEEAASKSVGQQGSGGGVARRARRLAGDHRGNLGAQRRIALGLAVRQRSARSLGHYWFDFRCFSAPDALSAVTCFCSSADSRLPLDPDNDLPISTEAPTI